MPQNCPKAGDLAVWCAAAGWCAPGRWQAQRMLLVRRAVHRAGMQVTWAVMRCCWTPCSSITFSACADPTLPYFTLTYPSPAPSERGVSQSKRAGHLGHGAPLLDGALQGLQRGGGRVRALRAGARLAHPGPRLQLDL